MLRLTLKHRMGDVHPVSQIQIFRQISFLDFIQEYGMTFEQAARARQAASGDHNRHETPLFDQSIARAARANR